MMKQGDLYQKQKPYVKVRVDSEENGHVIFTIIESNATHPKYKYKLAPEGQVVTCTTEDFLGFYTEIV